MLLSAGEKPGHCEILGPPSSAVELRHLARRQVRPAVRRGDLDGDLHATFLLNFFDEVRRKVPLDK